MKRKSNSQTIGEVLTQFLKENNLDDKMIQQKIISSWEEIAGKMIKNHTRNVYIFQRQLFVELDSDVIRHEVLMQKSQLIESVNRFAKNEIINSIIIK